MKTLKTLTIVLSLATFAACSSFGGKSCCHSGAHHGKDKVECAKGECKKDKSCCKDECKKCDGKDSCAGKECSREKKA